MKINKRDLPAIIVIAAIAISLPVVIILSLYSRSLSSSAAIIRPSKCAIANQECSLRPCCTGLFCVAVGEGVKKCVTRNYNVGCGKCGCATNEMCSTTVGGRTQWCNPDPSCPPPCWNEKGCGQCSCGSKYMCKEECSNKSSVCEPNNKCLTAPTPTR